MSDDAELYEAYRFHIAFMAAQTGDIAPLADYLVSDKPLTAENRTALAGLLRLWREFLDELLPGEDGRPRKPRRVGTPRGKLDRWRMANYIAVEILRPKVAYWLKKNKRKTIPEQDLKTLIGEVIKHLEKTPTSARRNWLDKDSLNAGRIFAIYRQSRRRQAGGVRSGKAASNPPDSEP
jgi:hypothetical protein